MIPKIIPGSLRRIPSAPQDPAAPPPPPATPPPPSDVHLDPSLPHLGARLRALSHLEASLSHARHRNAQAVSSSQSLVSLSLHASHSEQGNRARDLLVVEREKFLVVVHSAFEGYLDQVKQEKEREKRRLDQVIKEKVEQKRIAEMLFQDEIRERQEIAERAIRLRAVEEAFAIEEAERNVRRMEIAAKEAIGIAELTEVKAREFERLQPRREREEDEENLARTREEAALRRVHKASRSPERSLQQSTAAGSPSATSSSASTAVGANASTSSPPGRPKTAHGGRSSATATPTPTPQTEKKPSVSSLSLALPHAGSTTAMNESSIRGGADGSSLALDSTRGKSEMPGDPQEGGETARQRRRRLSQVSQSASSSSSSVVHVAQAATNHAAPANTSTSIQNISMSSSSSASTSGPALSISLNKFQCLLGLRTLLTLAPHAAEPSLSLSEARRPSREADSLVGRVVTGAAVKPPPPTRTYLEALARLIAGYPDHIFSGFLEGPGDLAGLNLAGLRDSMAPPVFAMVEAAAAHAQAVEGGAAARIVAEAFHQESQLGSAERWKAVVEGFVEELGHQRTAILTARSNTSSEAPASARSTTAPASKPKPQGALAVGAAWDQDSDDSNATGKVQGFSYHQSTSTPSTTNNNNNNTTHNSSSLSVEPAAGHGLAAKVMAGKGIHDFSSDDDAFLNANKNNNNDDDDF